MRARRHPTPEQKAKAAERRARFAELARKIAALTDDERTALMLKVGAITTVEGRTLSAHNTCLVLSQCPTASMVGGFQQWKAHGRSVRKGATGLGIWIPANKGKEGEPTPADVEAATAEGSESKRPGFVMGTVFDISQTETDAEREARKDAAATMQCSACGIESEPCEKCPVCGTPAAEHLP